MYKILEDNIMLRIAGKWYSTTAILTGVSGGKQVNFVDSEGNILKSQAFSRSKYGQGVKEGDGFGEESTQIPSLSDPDFMVKASDYTKKLREVICNDNDNDNDSNNDSYTESY